MTKKITDVDQIYAETPLKTPSETKEFKKLETKWYAKLEADGFEDIEDTTREGRPLKSWHTRRFKKLHVTKREASEIYYSKASELLHTYQFQSPTHKRIWELHCQGLSKRQIAEAIKDCEKPYKREQVGNIIKKITKEIQ